MRGSVTVLPRKIYLLKSKRITVGLTGTFAVIIYYDVTHTSKNATSLYLLRLIYSREEKYGK